MDALIAMSESETKTTKLDDGFRDNPERGLLMRCREWTDIFPWLRMTRVMRMVGSPIMLVISAVTLLLWHQIANWILQDDFRHQIHAHQSHVGVSGNLQVLIQWLKFAYQVNPTSILLFSERLFSWRWLLAGLWTLTIWSIPALIMIRQGITLTAGRGMESLTTTGSLALRRSLSAFAAVLIVLLGPILLSLGIWMVSLIHQALPVHPFLHWPCVLLLIMFSVFGGLLALASYFVLPLSLAAVVTESHPDPIDAASRGFESCLRRPLRLMGYLLLLAFLLITVFLIASGTGWCGERLIRVALDGVQSENDLLLKNVVVGLRLLPSAWMVTLFWGSVGSFYLLLRRDACEQEIEDIWIPQSGNTVSLPSLGTTESGELQ